MRIPLLLLALAACKPMYSGPSEPLHPVKPLPVPAQPITVLHYNDECETDFHASVRTRPQPNVAAPLIASGDANIASAKGAAQTDQLVRGIQHYADALRVDPYNAHATLALAVAYDRVLHRGCALAMLRRLEALAQNPQVSPEANDRIADVVDNLQWFKGYRKDALAAVNH